MLILPGKTASWTAGGAWTPADDSSIIAWWDASDEATITDSGGVTNWADKSGVGPDLTVPLGTPVTGNATYDRNGNNAIYFTNAENIKTSSGSYTLSLPANGNFLVTAAVEVESSAGGFRSMMAMSTSSDTWNYYGGTGFYGLLDCNGFGANLTAPTTDYSGLGVHIHQLLFDRTNTTIAIYVNGTLADSTTSAYTSNFPTSADFHVNSSTTNLEIEAIHCEYTITGAVDATTRGQHLDYMTTKWGA